MYAIFQHFYLVLYSHVPNFLTLTKNQDKCRYIWIQIQN